MKALRKWGLLLVAVMMVFSLAAVGCEVEEDPMDPMDDPMEDPVEEEPMDEPMEDPVEEEPMDEPEIEEDPIEEDFELELE